MVRANALIVALALVSTAPVAQVVPPDPASRAFEQGRWADAIAAFQRQIDAAGSEAADRDGDFRLGLSLLRIAQAERELGRHDDALGTLQRAAEAEGPEAMIHFERARNHAALGRPDDAMAELEMAEYAGLRALQPLRSAPELASLRGGERFARVERSVRDRVYPCESMREAYEFDFWIGRWEVRAADGSLAGHSTITRRDGDCGVEERWESIAGASGGSISFYTPSMEQWRQVWVGSGGTLFDISGGIVDGEMRMQGTLEYTAIDRVSAFRAAWIPLEDGVVRQLLEEYDSVTQAWRVWFDGYFRRIDAR